MDADRAMAARNTRRSRSLTFEKTWPVGSSRTGPLMGRCRLTGTAHRKSTRLFWPCGICRSGELLEFNQTRPEYIEHPEDSTSSHKPSSREQHVDKTVRTSANLPGAVRNSPG